MNDSERFLRLSEIYKDLTKTAFENLAVLKAQQGKGALMKFLAKPVLDQMKPFNLALVLGQISF
jgi:hypothetical protein